MKRNNVLIVLLCLLVVGCSHLTFLNDQVIVVTKTGYIQLNNNDTIFFKCALVSIDNTKIKIISDKLKYELSWKNVRVIAIYNECLQQEYIEDLKKIKEYSDIRLKKAKEKSLQQDTGKIIESNTDTCNTVK